MGIIYKNGIAYGDQPSTDAVAMIEPSEEASATSAHAYAVGEHFIYNDTLYRATAAIAIGDTITPGTNCTAVTVAGELEGKVDKVPGKQLSTEDYTTTEKTKLSGIEAQANKTVIDDTLTNTGEAADAKATGDAVSELRNTLLPYNSYNVLVPYPTGSFVSNGITFSWNGEKCNYTSGTTTGTCIYRLFWIDRYHMPDWMTPGNKYQVKVETTDSDVVLKFAFYKNGDDLSNVTFDEDGVVSIPSNAEGVQILITCPSGVSVTAGYIIAKVLTEKTNSELAASVEQLESDIDGLGSDVGKLTNAVNDIDPDLIWDKSKRVNKTVSNVTFAWNEDKTVCTINGTASGSDVFEPINGGTTAFPNGMQAGRRYKVSAKVTDDPNVFLCAYLYTGEGVYSGAKFFRRGTGVLEVASNITGLLFVVGVRTGYTATNSKVYDIAVSEMHPVDIGEKYFDFSDVTDGAVFDWDQSKGTCHITGSSISSAANDYLYNGPLPEDMNWGDRFLFSYKLNKNIDIRACIFFYNASGTELLRRISSMHVVGDNSCDMPFIVPNFATSMIVRIFIPYYSGSPTTFDVTVERLKLYKTVPRKMQVPLIISFVDDDATSTELVTRYHDACCHNGIKGNYAVLTRNMREYQDGGQTVPAATDKDLLLEYEDEGFGLLIHADYQGTTYWSPVDGQGNRRPHTEAEITQCRTNLCNGLRNMQEYGFVNFRYWVTPGGNFNDSLIEMAKGLGLKCLMSTNNDVAKWNSLQDYRQYLIRRISLRNTRSGDTSLETMKSAIDAMVADGGGWLIITTHFNDGWSETDTWDTTLDANGYPVGYSRFNEAVQYAITKGLTPMNVPQAWEYYEPIIEANLEDYSRTSY